MIGAAWPLLLATVTTCFNLEPRIAIVKHGEPDSYFGFSVSQHQIVSHDRLESLLLVGKLTYTHCYKIILPGVHAEVRQSDTDSIAYIYHTLYHTMFEINNCHNI